MNKQKRHTVWRKIPFVACLCLAGILGGAFGTYATDNPPAVNEWDFSDPESSRKTTALSGDLLYTKVCGESADEAVAEYLLHESGITLVMSDIVPSDSLTAVREDEGVRVTAAAYTYTAVNGSTVCWVPTTVVFNGDSRDMTLAADGSYTAFFFGAYVDGGTLSVNYCSQIFLNSQLCRALVNGAWGQASQVNDRVQAYLAEKTAYEADVAAYQQYQAALSAYHRDMDAYQTYLASKKRYERALAAYQAYETAQAAYEIALAEYEEYKKALVAYEQQYQAYLDYINENDAYRQAYDAYRANEQLRQSLLSKTYALDSCFVKSEKGSMMYATLMGDTVATVVSKKDEIVKYAGSWEGIPEAIDAADAATAELQVLLTEYQACKTEEQAYAFYCQHYQDIFSNFGSLYDSLRYLFSNNVVRSQIVKQGKLARYREFLSQLFVITACLDDNVTFDPNKAVADNIPVKDLIFGDQLLSDTNLADPKGVALPAALTPPTAPTPVEKPQVPTEVSQPVKPAAVSHPGEAPLPIEMPVEPTQVLPPAAAPKAPELTENDSALLALFQQGTLQEKNIDAQGATVAFETSLTKVLPAEGRFVLSYYDDDGKTLLHSQQVLEGDCAVFDGDLPQKVADVQYTYEFVGFADEQNNIVQDGFVPDKDMTLHAVYKQTPVYYTVTFRVGNNDYQTALTYGDLPTYPYEIGRDADAQYTYEFAGWSPAVSHVTKNAVYTAEFLQTERMYQISFDVNGSLYTYDLPYDATPSFDRIVSKPADGLYTYHFNGWSPAVAAVTGNARYTADFTPQAFCTDEEGTPYETKELLNEGFVVAVEGDTLINGALFSYAQENCYSVFLNFTDGGVTIPYEALSRLADVHSVTLSYDERGWTLSMIDDAGAPIGLDEAGVTLRLPWDRQKTFGASVYDSHTGTKVDTACFSDGYAHVTVESLPEAGLSLCIKRFFSVTGFADVGGTVFPTVAAATQHPSAVTLVAEPGDVVFLYTTPKYGYRIGHLSVEAGNGEYVPVGEDGSFVMPASPVTVNATFAEKTYTVTFMDGDRILWQSEVGFFETPPQPDPPSAREQDGMYATFKEWIKSGTPEQGHVIYKAAFTLTEPADPENTYRRYYEGWRTVDALLIAGILLVWSVGIIVLFKRRSKRKKVNKK